MLVASMPVSRCCSGAQSAVAAVPQLAMPAADHPTLACVPPVEPKVTRTLGLIPRQGRTLSPSARERYAMLETQRPARAATRRKSAR
jgi:hypothetical protein